MALYKLAPRHILTIPNQTIPPLYLLTCTSQAAEVSGDTRRKSENVHILNRVILTMEPTDDFRRTETLGEVSLGARNTLMHNPSKSLSPYAIRSDICRHTVRNQFEIQILLTCEHVSERVYQAVRH